MPWVLILLAGICLPPIVVGYWLDRRRSQKPNYMPYDPAATQHPQPIPPVAQDRAG